MAKWYALRKSNVTSISFDGNKVDVIGNKFVPNETECSLIPIYKTNERGFKWYHARKEWNTTGVEHETILLKDNYLLDMADRCSIEKHQKCIRLDMHREEQRKCVDDMSDLIVTFENGKQTSLRELIHEYICIQNLAEEYKKHNSHLAFRVGQVKIVLTEWKKNNVTLTFRLFMSDNRAVV